MKKSKMPNPFSKFQHHPDARKHQLVSFIKSFIRIAGYVWLPFDIFVAGFLLIISEVVGIYCEE